MMLLSPPAKVGSTARPSSRSLPWLALGLVGITAAWAYLPTLAALVRKWNTDPGYSHGFLVPAFCVYLLWLRKDCYPRTPAQPLPLLGLPLLALAVGARIAGAVIGFPWLDAISLLPAIAAVVLTFGGADRLRWSLTAILFLAFMVPLPYRVEVFFGGPLQRLATIGSTYALQTLGQPAVAEGNTILLHEFKLGVVEACSGLRMLVTFFTFATGAVLLIRKGGLEKTVIVLSAVPIALLSNILRITVTGLVFVNWDSKTANAFFHDLAGWFMMPVCLAMLWVELKLLDALVIEEDPLDHSLARPLRPHS